MRQAIGIEVFLQSRMPLQFAFKAIFPIPNHHQDLEEWNCELRDALEFGSPEVVACVSTLLAQELDAPHRNWS